MKQNGAVALSPENGFVVELGPEHAQIQRLIAALRTFADARGLPPRLVSRLALAFDELITNAIEHGAATGSPIVARVEIKDGRLIAELTDGGIAFDPFAHARPPQVSGAASTREAGGLGVHFVRTFFEHVAYAREGERNHVTLATTLDPAAPADGQPG